MRLIDLEYDYLEFYIERVVHLRTVLSQSRDHGIVALEWDIPENGRHFYAPDMINVYPFKEELDLR